jgi:hypothetical protein
LIENLYSQQWGGYLISQAPDLEALNV